MSGHNFVSTINQNRRLRNNLYL